MYKSTDVLSLRLFSKRQVVLLVVMVVIFTTWVSFKADSMPMGLKNLPKRTLARRAQQLGLHIIISIRVQHVERRGSINANPNQASSAWNGDPNQPCSSWETEPNPPCDSLETHSDESLDIWSKLNFDFSEGCNGLSFNWSDIGEFALSASTDLSGLTPGQIAMNAAWLAGTCFSMIHCIINPNRMFHPWLVVNQTGVFQNQAAWNIEKTVGFIHGNIYVKPKKHKTKGVVFIFRLGDNKRLITLFYALCKLA